MKRSIPLLSILFLLSHCGRKGEKISTGILDDRGVLLSLESPPQRIVSLVPSITEILYAIHGEGLLIGTTLYCNYPPEAKELPKVGDFLNPNLEKIFDLNPELIFATIPLHSSVIEKLENLGFMVFVLQPESIEGIENAIERIGQVIRKERDAVILVQKVRNDLLQREERVKRIDRRRKVYLEIGVNPLVSIGKRSYLGELIEKAGGINIVPGSEPYPIINPERVVHENPEVILIAHPGTTREEVKGRLGWGGIRAVREGRVFEIPDPDLIMRPGPRIAEGLDLLFQKIYPESREDLNPLVERR